MERRIQARKSLIAFTKYTKPDFQAGEHHHIIADKLEAVARGEIDRLMIFAPPRHTKSELGSRRFPSWYLGNYPDRQIITSTYSSEFSADFGRDVRDIVKSDEYGRLFITRLKDDSKSAQRWHTDKGGVYVSTGVGGPITGRGAHIALIDDPFKNREEADSAARRKTVIDWYRSTLYTRLMPGGAIILIMTRWHDEDLAGWLLSEAEKDGDQWEVVNLKAVDDNKALWPAWYPLEALERIKGAIGVREFEALYQQNPQPEEGVYFKREWFNRYPLGDHPKNTSSYGAGDYAVSDGEGDFTELGVIEVDSDKNIWFTDWWSGQTTSDVWIESTIDLMKKHSPDKWLAESGVIKKSTEPFLKSRKEARNCWTVLEWLHTSGDKRAMARAFQGMAASGKVWIPECDWGDDLISQLIRFDSGVFDDKVDVCGLFGRFLHNMWADDYEEDKPQPKLPDYGFNEDDDDSWKVA